MKNKILTIGLFFLSLNVFAQERENFNLLKTDSAWNQEVFQFPISFAPEINFEGFEDARFPKSWGKKDSDEYWSYAFVWSINGAIEITSNSLENYLETYFNGLMNYEHSSVLFIKTDASAKDKKYIGKLKTFDALKAKAMMTLNVTSEYFYCSQSVKTYILFKFSPKYFEHSIWETLDQITLHDNFCDK